MKTLILLAILILSGCGEQADHQTAKDQEKAHEHGEHCDHEHGDKHKD